MRNAFVWSVTITALLTAAATTAQAQEWCGYGMHDKSIIQCGYSNVADCESATGKGGMCFVDPDYALNVKRGVRLAPRQSLRQS
jgi:Protein of unknown function (DUF3551)